MKRKLLNAAAVIAAICLIVIIVFDVKPVSTRHVQSGAVMLNDDLVSLTAEDAQVIGKLFHGKIASRENPSCGFGEDFQIVLNCNGTIQRFYIGMDGCGFIYWQNEDIYFTLSEKEDARLRELLIRTYDCDGWF